MTKILKKRNRLLLWLTCWSRTIGLPIFIFPNGSHKKKKKMPCALCACAHTWARKRNVSLSLSSLKTPGAHIGGTKYVRHGHAGKPAGRIVGHREVPLHLADGRSLPTFFFLFVFFFFYFLYKYRWYSRHFFPWTVHYIWFYLFKKKKNHIYVSERTRGDAKDKANSSEKGKKMYVCVISLYVYWGHEFIYATSSTNAILLRASVLYVWRRERERKKKGGDLHFSFVLYSRRFLFCLFLFILEEHFLNF